MLFFGYFYTGQVSWHDGQAELGAAIQLLFLACRYNVPHLVCIAEMALQQLLDVDNCCGILAIADHHDAWQLKARCLHFIRQGHRLLKDNEQIASLSPELQEEAIQGMR